MYETKGGSRFKALALRYLPELPAPFLVAKAEGRLAGRLVAIAREAEVPVLSDAGMVDLLYPIELGVSIPVQFYEIVAKVFACVRSLEEA
jgi:flagellar biosynthesis protein